MIDWQLALILLRQHYKPLATVAKEVGSDWQHLNRLARGEIAEPRFNTGVRIYNLKQDGHDIRNTPISENGKRFACYWMKVARRG